MLLQRFFPLRSVLALLAGALSVTAFAPLGWFPMAFVSIAVLVVLLERTARARQGAWLGWLWGLGAFLAGVSWLYIALNRYGGVPMPLAGLAIFLFCAYLALFPALAAGLYVRLRGQAVLARAGLFAALWVLAELLRGWLFTGFPWLAVGYSQTPPSPLAGFLPLGGVYLVSGLVALCAALLALAPWRMGRQAVMPAGLTIVLLGGGLGLQQISWTAPQGESVRVALLQTNIEQDLKWQPELMRQWLDVNYEMAAAQQADIVVLPETSLPMLLDQLPEGYLEAFEQQALAQDTDVIVGAFARDAEGNIYNSTLSIGRSPSQFYAKRHLVPFGEYSPPMFGWFYHLVDIPMSDQTPGYRWQPPMELAGQRVALNICYEDLFGRELLDALPEATLMLNVSNLAWYGESLAQPQHLQISRVRAMEAGRPMLRSTNTGMTAWVEPDGRVMDVLPQFERDALVVDVHGYQGWTPYARWADWPALMLSTLMVVWAGWRRRRSR